MKKILLILLVCFQTSLFAQYLELDVKVLNLKESEFAKVTVVNSSTGAKEVTKYRFKTFPILLKMDYSYRVIIEAENYAAKTFDIDLICGPANKKAIFEMEVPMVVAPKTASVTTTKAIAAKPKETLAGYLRYVEKDKKITYKIAEKNKTGNIALN